MLEPFEAPRLKLDRARKHLQELTGAAGSYIMDRPVAIVVEQFPGMENHVPAANAWVARFRRPVPKTIAPIIGDVVHNLRAALDLMASDLVRLNGKNPHKVYFPFSDTPDLLPERIKKCRFDRAGAEAVSLLKSMKPYKGGNMILRAIHDMDVADKHQALLPTVGAVAVPVGSAFPGMKGTQFENMQTVVVKDGQMIVGYEARMSQIPLGTELPMRFFLTLGTAKDHPGFGGNEIVKFLHDLAKAADGVLEAFAALFPGATFPSSGP